MLPAVRKHENSSGGQGRAFGLVGYFCFSDTLVHKMQLMAWTPARMARRPLTVARLCRLCNLLSVLGGEMGELEAKWPSSPVKEGEKLQKYRGSDPMTMNIQYFRLLFLKEDCVHKQNQKIPFRVSPAFDSKWYVGSDFPFPGLSHYPIEFIRRLWLLAKRNG